MPQASTGSSGALEVRSFVLRARGGIAAIRRAWDHTACSASGPQLDSICLRLAQYSCECSFCEYPFVDCRIVNYCSQLRHIVHGHSGQSSVPPLGGLTDR